MHHQGTAVKVQVKCLKTGEETLLEGIYVNWIVCAPKSVLRISVGKSLMIYRLNIRKNMLFFEMEIMFSV